MLLIYIPLFQFYDYPVEIHVNHHKVMHENIPNVQLILFDEHKNIQIQQVIQYHYNQID
jgi:hypothetical protein